MNKKHCKDLFTRFGLNTDKLNRYDDDYEFGQDDLDDLTGWNERKRSRTAQIMALLAGITAAIACIAVVVSMLLRRRDV